MFNIEGKFFQSFIISFSYIVANTFKCGLLKKMHSIAGEKQL